MLVTGGAGFIGSHLVDRLLDEGHYVSVLDDLSSGTLDNLHGALKHPNFVHMVTGSIGDDREREKAFSVKPDVVFHLAASINVQQSLDDPERYFRSDVVGTFKVLEACRRENTRLVFVSTCMVYRTATAGAISEEHPVFPASPYAAAKLACEQFVISYGQSYKLPVVVCRPFNTYGPRQRTDGEGGVVAVFIARALAGEELRVYGDGTQTRDLLYATDCAEFLYLASRADEARGEILNAGTGFDIPIRDLARLIAKDEVPVKHVPHIHPQSEIMKLQCDPLKAERLLGWRPEVDLKTGLALTRKHLENQRLDSMRARRES